MVCLWSALSRLYLFKFFKGSPPQILLGPFLNTLSCLRAFISRLSKILIFLHKGMGEKIGSKFRFKVQFGLELDLDWNWLLSCFILCYSSHNVDISKAVGRDWNNAFIHKRNPIRHFWSIFDFSLVFFSNRRLLVVRDGKSCH